MKSKKLVCGVGINDVDYHVVKKDIINGKWVTVERCHYYNVWSNMIYRCYAEREHLRYPTYKNCLVSDEWLYFSNFKNWMESQKYTDRDLDKDILIRGNKIYSSDRCVFISPLVNKFILDRVNDRGSYLLGVTYHAQSCKLRAKCNNPFTGKSEHLGLFIDELQAHLAWKTRKHELACMLAESEYVDDPRVAEALRTRYL